MGCGLALPATTRRAVGVFGAPSGRFWSAVGAKQAVDEVGTAYLPEALDNLLSLFGFVPKEIHALSLFFFGVLAENTGRSV